MSWLHFSNNGCETGFPESDFRFSKAGSNETIWGIIARHASHASIRALFEMPTILSAVGLRTSVVRAVSGNLTPNTPLQKGVIREEPKVSGGIRWCETECSCRRAHAWSVRDSYARCWRSPWISASRMRWVANSKEEDRTTCGEERVHLQGTATVRESERRFRRVFEDGPLGFAFVGKDHRILKVNAALCQLLGYSEAELLQLSFPEITHPDDRRADLESAERLFRREIPFYRMRKRYVKKNGEIVWASLNATIIRDQESEPIFGLGVVEDITAVKRTQEAALARQKLESLGVLVGGIAHDFNNLLGGILAEAELAEDDIAANLPPTEQIARIKAVANRGVKIVRELMIYAGQDRASIVEPVDLSRLVEEMRELLKVSVSKQIDLKIELDKKLPAVLGSVVQIRQVVMNLVTNASEAIGSKEGVIHLSTSLVVREPGSAVNEAPELAPGDYVRLEVSDTGCGMTEEVRDKIFDPFFTTKFPGRGLGLAIVRGIVRAHGGAADLVSAPGHGATFQVLLPCTSMRPSKILKAKAASPAKRASGTGTILVVEDEEVLRLAVSKALRNWGYSVLNAGDGSSAMDRFLAHKNEIDAILLDVTLPGKSSREVFEEILHVRPNLTVILTSAYSEETVATAFTGLRIVHFIRKPFKLAELASVLRDVLPA